MFKSTNNNGVVKVKENLEQSLDIFNEKLSDGLKVAEGQIHNLRDYLDERQRQNMVRKTIKKHPAASALAAVTMVGSLAYGIYSVMNMFKKK